MSDINRKFSKIPQADSVPYSDSNGFLTAWLENDPLIQSLMYQNEFIGTIENIADADTLQTTLTNFVQTQVSRSPREGDLVNVQKIENISVNYQYRYSASTSSWLFYIQIEIKPATTTTLGTIKVGSNLSITSDGTLSADIGSSSFNNYLPLSGGTISGNLSITGTLSTSSTVTASNGVLIGANDKGIANGVASLNSNAVIPSSQIPIVNQCNSITDQKSNTAFQIYVCTQTEYDQILVKDSSTLYFIKES